MRSISPTSPGSPISQTNSRIPNSVSLSPRAQPNIDVTHRERRSEQNKENVNRLWWLSDSCFWNIEKIATQYPIATERISMERTSMGTSHQSVATEQQQQATQNSLWSRIENFCCKNFCVTCCPDEDDC